MPPTTAGSTTSSFMPGTNNDMDTRVFCGLNIRRTLGPIEMFYVEEVGIGKGPRSWTGPKVFSCEARR